MIKARGCHAWVKQDITQLSWIIDSSSLGSKGILVKSTWIHTLPQWSNKMLLSPRHTIFLEREFLVKVKFMIERASRKGRYVQSMNLITEEILGNSGRTLTDVCTTILINLTRTLFDHLIVTTNKS